MNYQEDNNDLGYEIKKNIMKMISDRSRITADSYYSEAVEFPLLIIRLGKEMDDIDDLYKSHLVRLIPAYENCLMYYKYDIHCKKFYYEGECIDDNYLVSTLTEQFEEGSYYRSYNQLMVYFLIDSEVLNDDLNAVQLLNTVSKLKERIAFQEQIIHLIMMINEKIGYEDKAKLIKNQFGEILGEESVHFKEDIQSVYLISNKSNDGMFNNNDRQCRIVANLIVLTNSGEDYLLSATKSSWMHTIGFNMVEKPSKKIADICIYEMTKLIGELMGDVSTMADAVNMPMIEKLRLDPGKVFSCFESIITESMKSFPTYEQLELFPRIHSNEVGEMRQLKMKDFDNLTLGAWNAYIKRLINDFEAQLSNDQQLENAIRKDFRDYLKTQFPLFDLMSLSKKTDEIRYSFFSVANCIDTSQDDLYFGVMKELNKNLLSNEKVITIFCDEAKKLGNKGEELFAYWTALSDDIMKRTLFNPRDRGVIDFYSKRVKSFFDTKAGLLQKELRNVSSNDELKQVFFTCFQDLVTTDTVFGEPFEREMQIRLQAQSPKIAQNEIRKQLTGTSAKTWFVPTGTVIDNPVVSVIMLRTDSELHSFLKNNLGEESVFYNTNNGDSADVIRIYELEKNHLI